MTSCETTCIAAVQAMSPICAGEPPVTQLQSSCEAGWQRRWPLTVVDGFQLAGILGGCEPWRHGFAGARFWKATPGRAGDRRSATMQIRRNYMSPLLVAASAGASTGAASTSAIVGRSGAAVPESLRAVGVPVYSHTEVLT